MYEDVLAPFGYISHNQYSSPDPSMYGAGDFSGNWQIPEINDQAPDEVSLLTQLGFDPAKMQVGKDGRVAVSKDQRQQAIGAALSALGAGLNAGLATASWSGIHRGLSGGIADATSAYKGEMDAASDRNMKNEMMKLQAAGAMGSIEEQQMKIKAEKERMKAEREMRTAIKENTDPYFNDVKTAIDAMASEPTDGMTPDQIRAKKVQVALFKNRLNIAKASIQSGEYAEEGLESLMKLSSELPAMQEVNAMHLARLAGQTEATKNTVQKDAENAAAIKRAKDFGANYELSEDGSVEVVTPDKKLSRTLTGKQIQNIDSQIQDRALDNFASGGNKVTQSTLLAADRAATAAANKATAAATRISTAAQALRTNPGLPDNVRRQIAGMSDHQILQNIVTEGTDLYKLDNGVKSSVYTALGANPADVAGGANGFSSSAKARFLEDIGILEEAGIKVNKDGSWSEDISNPVVMGALAERVSGEKLGAAFPTAEVKEEMFNAIDSKIGTEVKNYIATNKGNALERLQGRDTRLLNQWIIRVKQGLGTQASGASSAAQEATIRSLLAEYINSNQ